MDYIKLGNTGLDVSRLCLGCMTYGIPDRGNHAWTLDEETSRPLLRQAVEAYFRLPGSTSSTRQTSTPTAHRKKSSAAR